MLRKLQQIIGRWTQSSGFFSALISRLNFGLSEENADRKRERLGLRGEKAAARFLKQKGYRIIDHGHRQRRGEIDLIAVERDCIVFVEVKTWHSDAQADPSEAVDHRKQERLTRAALIYLKQHRLLNQAARFDVIAVVWPAEASQPTSIRHFENAFEAVGKWQMYR